MADDPEALFDPDDFEGETDPLVEECLRDALGPYLGVLSPAQIADHRAFLTLYITTHPAAAPLYERLRKRRLSGVSADLLRERPDTPEGEVRGASNGKRK